MISIQRNKAALACLLAMGGLVLYPRAATATTATTTMSVTMTITSGCQVSAGTVAFASSAGLFSAVAANATLTVTCTSTTPYVISLDAGSGTGATTTVRKMTGPRSATIHYSLYQNAGLSTNFGNTSGTDTVAGTGTGAAQTVTVYGQVPAQASPAAGSYSDIVHVSITY